MIHKTRGIVFKTIKFSETSVVSKIYTEKFGMQSYIVNGVRSPKSKFKAGMLQSLSLLDLEVYYRENRNLNRIKEFQSAYIFKSLPFDLLKGAVGLFMIEVLNKSIKEEEVNERLFHFIFEKIKSMDQISKVPTDFLLQFLIELCAYLGFFPNGKFSEATPHFDLNEGTFIASPKGDPNVLEPALSRLLSLLIQKQPAVISGEQRKFLLEALLQYYRLHVPNFSQPKSLRVLEVVFKN